MVARNILFFEELRVYYEKQQGVFRYEMRFNAIDQGLNINYF